MFAENSTIKIIRQSNKRINELIDYANLIIKFNYVVMCVTLQRSHKDGKSIPQINTLAPMAVIIQFNLTHRNTL